MRLIIAIWELSRDCCCRIRFSAVRSTTRCESVAFSASSVAFETKKSLESIDSPTPCIAICTGSSTVRTKPRIAPLVAMSSTSMSTNMIETIRNDRLSARERSRWNVYIPSMDHSVGTSSSSACNKESRYRSMSSRMVAVPRTTAVSGSWAICTGIPPSASEINLSIPRINAPPPAR